MDNSILLNSLNKKINNIINTEFNNYIQLISNKYNININELNDLINNNNNNNNNKCLARKQDGLQCTRNKKPNEDYCGKHIHNRKFGRIDDNNHNIDDNLLKTTIENLNGENYLVDSDNYVYTNNIENPTLIGKKENNNLILIE